LIRELSNLQADDVFPEAIDDNLFWQSEARLLKNTPFCPISALRSDFNPRNIQYIPVVKILTRLDLDQNWAFFKGLQVLVCP